MDPGLQQLVVDTLEEVPDVQLADDPGVLFIVPQPLLDVALPVVRPASWDGAEHEGAHAVHDAGMESLDSDVVHDLLREVVRLDDLPLFVGSVFVNDDGLVVSGVVAALLDHDLERGDGLLHLGQPALDVLPGPLSL